MMNIDILDAIGDIDVCYISEAYGIRQRKRRQNKKRNYKLIIAVAAALVLAVGGWAVLTRPYLFFNGEANELDIDVMYEAKVLTADELEALGGTLDRDLGGDTESSLICTFDSISLNELFSAVNISPLRSSQADYDSGTYAEVGFGMGASSLSYVAVDSETGKRAKVQMTWYNTREGLSMGETYLMMKNYETYTLPCGAEAMISLPDPDVPKTAEEQIPEEEYAEERTKEEQLFDERNVPDAFTWIWFTHDNISYFIRTQHDSEGAKAFLDSFL